MDIDPSNYNSTPVETKTDQKTTVGNLKKAINQMKAIPKKKKLKESVNISQKRYYSPLSTGTRTVSHTLHEKPYDLTLTQTGSYVSKPQYDAWTSAGASSASVSSNTAGLSYYEILKQDFNAYVSSPNTTNSALHQNSDLTIGGYVGGSYGHIKVTEFKRHSEVSWTSIY